MAHDTGSLQAPESKARPGVTETNSAQNVTAKEAVRTRNSG